MSPRRCFVVVDRDGHVQQLDHPTAQDSAPQISGDCVAWYGTEIDEKGKTGNLHIWIALPPNQQAQSIFAP